MSAWSWRQQMKWKSRRKASLSPSGIFLRTKSPSLKVICQFSLILWIALVALFVMINGTVLSSSESLTRTSQSWALSDSPTKGRKLSTFPFMNLESWWEEVCSLANMHSKLWCQTKICSGVSSPMNKKITRFPLLQLVAAATTLSRKKSLRCWIWTRFTVEGVGTNLRKLSVEKLMLQCLLSRLLPHGTAAQERQLLLGWAVFS